jgi:hypothetical protein
LRGGYHHNTGSSLRVDRSLQCIKGTAFRTRALPGVNRDVGRLGWVAFAGGAIERIRREEPFHALHVTSGCTVADVHVAAANPLGARRHADLVTHSIIANRSSGGVTSVEVIIARLLRIVPARVAHAVMNRVVPIVIVIGILPVPAAIVRFKRIMRPALTGISAGYNNVLSGEP